MRPIQLVDALRVIAYADERVFFSMISHKDDAAIILSPAVFGLAMNKFQRRVHRMCHDENASRFKAS